MTKVITQTDVNTDKWKVLSKLAHLKCKLHVSCTIAMTNESPFLMVESFYWFVFLVPFFFFDTISIGLIKYVTHSLVPL